MSLTTVAARGALTGFGNLLDKELGSWWRTRRWLVHLVLWQVVITGFILLVSLEQRGDTTAQRGVNEAMQVFFQAGGFFGLIGAVLVTQGAIVGEKASGTAAWVLTKPTTRKSMVLAKMAGISGSFLTLGLVLPAIAVLLVCQTVWGRTPDLVHFSEAVAIVGLHHVCYIAITLMLGAFFRSRGPVAGIALGFWLAGNILPNFVPPWLLLGTPWLLAPAAASIAVWQPLAFPLWVPMVASSILTVVALGLALWRFDREEF
ncbi:MAG: hypothetical protein FJ206_01845 [Gemmatimonadetes bacterium]|nr:hypothetical protein [Gemmatimonadota bacterium]